MAFRCRLLEQELSETYVIETMWKGGDVDQVTTRDRYGMGYKTYLILGSTASICACNFSTAPNNELTDKDSPLMQCKGSGSDCCVMVSIGAFGVMVAKVCKQIAGPLAVTGETGSIPKLSIPSRDTYISKLENGLLSTRRFTWHNFIPSSTTCLRNSLERA